MLISMLVFLNCGSNTPTVPTPTPAGEATPGRGTLTGTISFLRSNGFNTPSTGPLPFARVEAIDGPDVGAYTVTDDCGRYRLDLPAAALSVRISKTSYTPAVASARIAINQTTTLNDRLNFAGRPEAPTVPLWTISGTVTDASSGAPIDLAVVNAHERTTDVVYDVKQTDKAGRFRLFTTLEPVAGVNYLLAYKDGYVTQRVQLPPDIGMGDAVIDMQMQRGANTSCVSPP